MTTLSTFPSLALQSSALMHRLLTPSLLSATLINEHQTHQNVPEITHSTLAPTYLKHLLAGVDAEDRLGQFGH